MTLQGVFRFIHSSKTNKRWELLLCQNHGKRQRKTQKRDVLKDTAAGQRDIMSSLLALYTVSERRCSWNLFTKTCQASPPAKVALPLSQVSMKWLFIRQRLIETQASDVDRVRGSVLSPLARCTESLLVSNISLSTKSIALGDAPLTITPSFQTESFHYSHSHFYKWLSFSDAFP